MQYDRAEIMKAAWVIVRRFQGNGETLPALLSRALTSAWFTAKLNASAAARQPEALEARSAADLQAQIQDMENRDTLGHEGIERLAELRAACRVAEQREHAAAELEEKRALIASAEGRFATVVFTKKDGTRRVMRVQPAKLKYHVKGDAACEAAQKAVKTRAARHPNLMPVWDTEAAAPRSVNLETVSRIAVNGAVHEYPIQ
ncbi:hypothetical protein [uncultured Roseovarius sp.]|uniref:hypothetical protein n=1 Tax=uncultured Roseovarius sp. TaxID=293344 RepID=UPI002593DE7C|nr:hypothetical protein [uncultured Roseovarius sp.]